MESRDRPPTGEAKEAKEAAQDDILTAVDKMVDDTNRSAGDNKDLAVRTCRRLGAAISLDTPIAVMKLCAVKKLDKRVLLLEVIALFDQLHARFAANDTPLLHKDRSRRPAAAASDLLTVESTTLGCMQMSFTQDSFLTEVLLYVVQTHEVKLSTFSLALLLTMAHIRRHQEATLNLLSRYIHDQLSAAGKRFEWVGLSDDIDEVAGVLHDRDVEQLLVGTAEQSLRMDAIRPYVTALAIRLIDTDCKKDSSDVVRVDQIHMHRFKQVHFEPGVDVKANTAAVNCVYLGVQVIELLFRQSGNTALYIVDQLCSHIIAQHNTPHFLAVLHRLIHRYREVFFEPNSRQEYPLLQKLEAVVQQLTSLPPLHALHFIGCVLPLLHADGRSAAKQSLRSQLLMAMKKTIFQPDDSSRLLACCGIVCLIEGVLRSEVIGPQSSYGLSQSSQSSQPSSSQREPFMDQTMLSELLAMLRRTLSASADVRSKLYEQLTLLSSAYPAARSHVLNLVLPMFFNVYRNEAAGICPFQLVKCVFAGQITDPLHHLFFALLRCVLHPAPPPELPGSADWAATIQNLRATLDDAVDRLTRLTPKDIGYQHSTAITADTDVSRPLLMHGVYQAAMEWTLCKKQAEESESGRRASRAVAAVSNETWEVFMRLFDRFNALEGWLTGKKKDGEAKGTPTKKPKKKSKKRDEDEDSTESEDDDDDDRRSRATGRSQRSQHSQRSKKKASGKSAWPGKRRIAVSSLLSPQALQVAHNRLLTVTNSEYPTQVLSKDLDLQRFLLRSAEDAVDRLADRLSSSSLDAYLGSFESECTMLSRTLWNYSSRLWVAYQTARVDLKETVKGQSSMLALSLHALENVLALAGRYRAPFLTGRLDKMLTGDQRRCLELLRSQHGDHPLLPIHACVSVFQEQTAAHIEAERLTEAGACVSLLSFFSSHLASDDSPHAVTGRAESGNWAVTLLTKPHAGQPTIVRRLLAYLQPLNPQSSLWTQIIDDLLAYNGTAQGKPSDGKLQFKAIDTKTTTAFATAVCTALNRDMDQCDWLLAQTKPINTYAPPDMGAAAGHDERKEPRVDRPAKLLLARQQYNEQCWRRLLCVAQLIHHIAPGAFVKSELEKIGHTLTRVLKLITLAASQVYSAARSPSKPFSQLMDFTVATLCPSTDRWQQYMTVTSQRVRDDESAAELKREARMLPELQKAFSACETAIIRLSRADFCRSDYTRRMQRYKTRDFQLVAQRKHKNRHSRSDSEEEEEEDDDDEDSAEDSDGSDEEGRSGRRRRQQQQSTSRQQGQRIRQSQKSQRSQSKRKRQADSGESSEEERGSDKENRPTKRAALKSETESDS